MNCAEFFSQLNGLDDSKQRGDTIRTVPHAQLIGWQNESASPDSPGPVADAEMLRLALYEGRQVVDGVLHRNAFSPLMSLGLSTDRSSHAPLLESMDRAQKKAKRDGKAAWGYVEMSVMHIRSLKATDAQLEAIGVYDTAIPRSPEGEGNPSHAEGFMLVKTSNSMPLRSLQADLLDAYREQLNRWPEENLAVNEPAV